MSGIECFDRIKWQMDRCRFRMDSIFLKSVLGLCLAGIVQVSVAFQTLFFIRNPNTECSRNPYTMQ
jgi:hypothetical protein